jgi:hypothetical protein
MTRRKLTDDALFAIGLFVIAFVLRYAVARALAGEPVWDGHYYDFGARRIAEGHGYSDDRIVEGQTEWHPWCHYPVGYSAFLAFFYRVLGTESWVSHLANALTGAALVVVVFALGLTALDSKRARLAGSLAAIHPGLVLYGALVMGELLSALTILVGFLVAIRVRGLRGVALGALILGVSALVRPQALLCAPFLVVVAPGERLRALVVACALPFVPIAPWTARNCRVMDGCALVSTNAGWNLAIGSFPRATGRFETLRASDGCREVTGQVQQDRCWLHYGLENIRADPGRWLALVPAKLSNTFDHESFAIEYLREARPHAFPEERRVTWRSALTAIHRVLVVLMPLSFIAFVRRGRRRDVQAQGALLAATAIAGGLAIAANPPAFWPIVIGACLLPLLPVPGRPSIPPALALPIVLVATTALTHAVFFGDDRYHMVITPVLCLFAAAMLRKPEIE